MSILPNQIKFALVYAAVMFGTWLLVAIGFAQTDVSADMAEHHAQERERRLNKLMTEHAEWYEELEEIKCELDRALLELQ